MDDSLAHPKGSDALWDIAAWKTALSAVAAILLGLLFLVAGIWKVTDPFGAAARLAQARVPFSISLPSAILLGISETLAGALVMVPRFRRWGAWLSGLLLAAFMVYMAVYYDVLRGEECNCFPLIKRVVGPAFFIGDAVMLLLAWAAGRWARPSESRRSAVLVLAAVSVFALVSYGVAAARQSAVRAPSEVTVDGQPFRLDQGRVLLYFFDPECSHCDQAARRLAQHQWKDVKLIAVPTANPQFAGAFVQDTGLKAGISTDAGKLRETFSFTDPPYAVALENGRQRQALAQFDTKEPEAALKSLGFIQ